MLSSNAPAAGSDALLEREHELGILQALAARARGGSGSLAVIEGEAGIGKTRLLEEFAERQRAAGMLILTATGAELERGFSFGVVRQLFEQQVARAPDEEHAALLDGAAALARPLFGVAPVEEAPIADVAHATVHGVYWLLSNLADRQPVLVAIDDVHWSDIPSLRWIAYLAPRVADIRTLVALAVRAEEADGKNHLLQTITRHVRAKNLRLSGLSIEATHLLLGDAIADASESLCVACHQATRGNPFYLREVVQAISLAGAPHELDVPQALRALDISSIARAVLARLATLSEPAAQVARAVAVLGRDAQPRRVAELLALDRAAVAVAADRLIAAQILRSGPPLEFVHPIVRDAIYSQIGPTTRAGMHAEAAGILARSGTPVDRVAAHLLAAEPGSAAAAHETLRQVAAEAMSRGAPDVAIRYLERALAEELDEETEAELRLRLGLARFSAFGLDRGHDDVPKGPARFSDDFDPQAKRTLLRALELTADQRRRVGRALLAGRALGNQGFMDDAFDIYRHVLDDLREVDDELAARCLFEAVAQGFTNPANARMAQQYRARLRRLSANGNVAPIVELDTAFELAAGGRDASRVVLLATGALRKLTEANEYSGALIAAFFCLVWADQAPTVVTAITTALEQSSPGKLDYLSFYRQAALSARAMALNRCGELLRAEDDARSSIDRTMSPGFLLESLTEQGRLQDAADLLDDRALAGDLPDRLPSAILLPSRAKFHLARNQPERAVEDLRQCSRIWSGMHGLNPACCTWRSQLALVLDRLGDHCQAAELAQEELVRARAFGAASAIGTALRAVALVGQASERVELLDGAVTALGRSPSRLEHARALLDLGRALRQAGERAKAREDLALAMDLAHRCGARPLAEQAREELVIAGARPRRQRVTGADALTASERRIATMAADGMTNREIAQALFITTKTVAHHLTHIYDKLGIVGRRELAQALKAE